MTQSFDLQRRQFALKAMALGTSAALWPAFNGWGQHTRKEIEQENEKQANALYNLTFCSPYDSALAEYSPHMHSEFKRNVEHFSEGKIFVQIRDNGFCGIGTELMAEVSRGNIDAALVSVSNLSPAAPVLDILNIPFWSADNQAYVNLITSEIWQRLVIERIRAQGKIDILFHYVPGPRTATTTKIHNKVLKTPGDLKELVFRVPASKMLDIFYQLAGTNPVNVAWKDVALLAKNGRINAMDPGIIGLYNGPGGLRDHIGTISLIESVHDGWVAVINQDWLNRLPVSLKEALFTAAEQTFKTHLQQVVKVTERCSEELRKRGTVIYTPTAQEKALWIERCGHQQSKWRAVKKQLLGDEKIFNELLQATQINNGYTYR